MPYICDNVKCVNHLPIPNNAASYTSVLVRPPNSLDTVHMYRYLYVRGRIGEPVYYLCESCHAAVEMTVGRYAGD